MKVGARTRCRAARLAAPVLGVIGLLVLLQHSVVQACFVPTHSMEPALFAGDLALADELGYGSMLPFTALRLPRFRAPRRGDMVLFRAPDDPPALELDRCVALAGETVEVRRGRVWVDGRAAAETAGPASRAARGARPDLPPRTVPPGQGFVVGDRLDVACDSRHFGPVPEAAVAGRAVRIYWSVEPTTGRVPWDRLFRAVE